MFNSHIQHTNNKIPIFKKITINTRLKIYKISLQIIYNINFVLHLLGTQIIKAIALLLIVFYHRRSLILLVNAQKVVYTTVFESDIIQPWVKGAVYDTQTFCHGYFKTFIQKEKQFIFQIDNVGSFTEYNYSLDLTCFSNDLTVSYTADSSQNLQIDNKQSISKDNCPQERNTRCGYGRTVTLSTHIRQVKLIITSSTPDYCYLHQLDIGFNFECVEGCFNCQDANNCKPDGCENGFTFMIRDAKIKNQQVCVRNCPNGCRSLKSDLMVFYVCKPYKQNCAFCKYYYDECSECLPGYFYNPQSQICELSCPQGCSSCSQNKSCTQCLQGFTQKTNPINSALQYCQKNCQQGQYNYLTDNNTMAQECRSCINNCLSCTSFDDCNNCQSGYGYSSQKKQCICTEGCSNCDQYISCTQCNNFYTQTQNPNNSSQQYCKKNCPQGQYSVITDQQTMAQQYTRIYKFMLHSSYKHVIRQEQQSKMNLQTYKLALNIYLN
ncbi:hypothetical protein ABPG73_019734 [Tetrahymena malaccensis]